MMRRVLAIFLAWLVFHGPAFGVATTMNSLASWWWSADALSGTNVQYTIGVAVDEAADLLWYRSCDGTWHGNGGGADPVTGTSGLSISGISGSYYPATGSYGINTILYSNFGSRPFNKAAPSGFSSVNTAVGSAVTINPSDKSANITLSDGDLVGTQTANDGTASNARATSTIPTSAKVYYEFGNRHASGGGSVLAFQGAANGSAPLATYLGIGTGGVGWHLQNGFVYVNGSNITNYDPYQGPCNTTFGARATSSKSTDKWLFEVVLTYAASGQPVFGIGNSTASINLPIGNDTNGIGCNAANGNIQINAVTQTPNCGTMASGVAALVAVDLTAKKFWVYSSSSGLWNNDVIGNQNPATGTGGVTFAFSGPYFPSISVATSALTTMTVNFGATAFVNAGASPSGFCAWDAPGPAPSCVAGRPRGYVFGANDNDFPPWRDNGRDACEWAA